jgi:hypothetical protein
MINPTRGRIAGVNGKTPKRRVRALARAIVIAAAGLAAGAAFAAPATLANDSDIAAFAARIKDYAGASRVHWIVAARTRAAADVLVSGIGLHLSADDRELMTRVKAEAFADNPDLAPDSSIPVAWMAPQIGQSQGAPSCSWQVWVSDPGFPSAATGALNVPLAPNDRLPVSSEATFRIGYTGLLQSKLYAFGETQPGAIRDLAAAPDVNIPVTASAAETIVLAMARQPVPFYEYIRTALAANAGQRKDLGKEYALRDKEYALNDNRLDGAPGLGGTRGLGASFQTFSASQVTIKERTPKPEAAAQHVADAQAADLMEKCLFSLTPAKEAP